MARPSTIAVGLRLPVDVLEKANQAAASMGLNRSALIVLAINKLCDGDTPATPPAAPVSAPSTSAVDEPARTALMALKDRVEVVEQWIRDAEAGRAEMERRKEEALAQQAATPRDDFAAMFSRG